MQINLNSYSDRCTKSWGKSVVDRDLYADFNSSSRHCEQSHFHDPADLYHTSSPKPAYLAEALGALYRVNISLRQFPLFSIVPTASTQVLAGGH